MKGWKKIFHANGNQKKAGVAILIAGKIDFKIKTVTRDKEGHYIMITGSIQEEDITIINVYAPSIGAFQYIKQMLTTMKGEIDSNTIIVGDFNKTRCPSNQSTFQIKLWSWASGHSEYKWTVECDKVVTILDISSEKSKTMKAFTSILSDFAYHKQLYNRKFGLLVIELLVCTSC